MAAFNAGNIKGFMVLETGRWLNSLTKATKMTSAGTAVMTTAFRGLTLATGVAAAGLVKITLEANKFRGALSDIKIVSTGTDIAIGKTRIELLKMDKALGDATSLAQGMRIAVSAGAREFKSAMEITARGSMFATAHMLKQSTAIDMLTTVMNGYKKATGEATISIEKAGDMLNNTIEFGKVLGPELARSLGKVIPMFGELNVPLEQVLASITELTKTGVTPFQTMTQLRGLVVQMLKPSEALNAIIKDLTFTTDGVSESFESATELIGKKGLTGVFEFLNVAAAGSNDKLAKLLPNVRALMGAIKLSGKGLEDFKAAIDNITKTGTLQTAFEAKEKTLKTTKNLLKDTQIIIGDPAWAVFKVVLDDINKEWKKMNDFLISDQGQTAMLHWALGMETALTAVQKSVVKLNAGFKNLHTSTKNAVLPILTKLAKIPGKMGEGFLKHLKAIPGQQEVAAKIELDIVRKKWKKQFDIAKEHYDEIQKMFEEGASDRDLSTAILIATKGARSDFEGFINFISDTSDEAILAYSNLGKEAVSETDKALQGTLDVIDQQSAARKQRIKELLELFKKAKGAAAGAGGAAGEDRTVAIKIKIPLFNVDPAGQEWARELADLTGSLIARASAKKQKEAQAKATAEGASAADARAAGEKAGKDFADGFKASAKQAKIGNFIAKILQTTAKIAQGILNGIMNIASLSMTAETSKIERELFFVEKRISALQKTIGDMETELSESEARLDAIKSELGEEGPKTLQDLKDELEEKLQVLNDFHALNLQGLEGFAEGEHELALASFEDNRALLNQKEQDEVDALAAEIARKEEALNAEKAALEKHIANLEEEKAANETALAAEQAAKEEHQAELNKLAEKNFKNQKAFSIAQVWIDAARAIAGFWATFYWNPPMAIALSAGATGMAITQTSLINKQEFVPQYAEGTSFHGGGQAMVGERGPEIIDLPKGTSVTPNNQTRSILNNLSNNPGDTYIITVDSPVVDSKERIDDMVDVVVRRVGDKMRGRAA